MAIVGYADEVLGSGPADRFRTGLGDRLVGWVRLVPEFVLNSKSSFRSVRLFRKEIPLAYWLPCIVDTLPYLYCGRSRCSH